MNKELVTRQESHYTLYSPKIIVNSQCPRRKKRENFLFLFQEPAAEWVTGCMTGRSYSSEHQEKLFEAASQSLLLSASIPSLPYSFFPCPSLLEFSGRTCAAFVCLALWRLLPFCGKLYSLFLVCVCCLQPVLFALQYTSLYLPPWPQLSPASLHVDRFTSTVCNGVTQRNLKNLELICNHGSVCVCEAISFTIYNL